MFRVNWGILLEALAVTGCLLILVGQQAETEQLTSKATVRTLQNSLDPGRTLLVEQTPRASYGKTVNTNKFF